MTVGVSRREKPRVPPKFWMRNWKARIGMNGEEEEGDLKSTLGLVKFCVSIRHPSGNV